eukprot:6458356-Amphidinium_carterae.1
MEKQAARSQKTDGRRRDQSSDNRWGGSSQHRQYSSGNRWGGSSWTTDWHRWQERQAGASGATSSRAPRPTSSGAQVTNARWSEKVTRMPSLCALLSLQHLLCMNLVFRCGAFTQTPPCLLPVPMPLHTRRQQDRHCAQHRGQHMPSSFRCSCPSPRQVLQVSHHAHKAYTAEADSPLAKIGVRLLMLLVFSYFFELGSAAGSPADSESSTPSHLFQETPLPPSNPPVTQGATYHPMFELALLEAHMQFDPGNEVLIAER